VACLLVPVSQVAPALRSLGLLDDTIIVFVTDHGNHFKTRNAEYKRSCHEATIRLPCFATGPGFTGGGRVDELLSLVDLPPTMLDAAGVEVPSRMEGRSALPLLRLPGGPERARSLEWPDHVFVQISESQTGRAVRTRRWKYSVAHEAADGSATGPALEHADTYTEEFLYDLAHDPYELENLVHAASHVPVRERLRSLLLDHIRAVEGREPDIIEATTRPSGQRRVSPEEVLE